MSSTRVHSSPSFSAVEGPAERAKMVKEIQKIKPPVEVTIEGLSEVAKGRIIDWNDSRKLLTVKWEKRSSSFDDVTNAKTGLRAFFKAPLFSTQVVFKTTTVRRLEDGSYHYRIPEELFQQQRRGALRVPLSISPSYFYAKEGKFKILDLSVGGASLRTTEGKDFAKLTSCEMMLQGKRLGTPDFSAQVTFRNADRIGVRFAGLGESTRIQIKQFLIEALKQHYDQGL